MITMRAYALILLLTLASTAAQAQDIRMGKLILLEKENLIFLGIEANKQDLELALARTYGDRPETLYAKETKRYLQAYLDLTLSFSINGVCTNPKISKVFEKDGHIIIEAAFSGFYELIQRIECYNTFMIQEIPGFFNMMDIQLNGKTRSYRIDRDRVVIYAQY